MEFEAGRLVAVRNVEPVRLSKRSATVAILRLKWLELVRVEDRSEAQSVRRTPSKLGRDGTAANS